MRVKFGPRFLSVLLVQFVFACLAFQVRAQTDDPPTRAARLADLEGSVTLQPAGTKDCDVVFPWGAAIARDSG
jgi:hypothetical protein